MRIARLFAVVLISVLVLTGTALVLVPIEEDTCPQLYGEFFSGSATQGTFGRTTMWDCWDAIRVARRKEAAIAQDEYDRSHPTDEQLAELQRRSELARAEAARVAKEKEKETAIRAENEKALFSQFRGVLCPLLAEKTEGEWSVSMIAGRSDALVFGIHGVCRNCQYKREPTLTLQNIDGSVFCQTDGVAGDDCPRALSDLQVRIQATRTGTPDALRKELGCLR